MKEWLILAILFGAGSGETTLMRVEAGRKTDRLDGVDAGLYPDLRGEYWVHKPTKGQLHESLGSGPLRRARKARCSKCPNQHAYV